MEEPTQHYDMMQFLESQQHQHVHSRGKESVRTSPSQHMVSPTKPGNVSTARLGWFQPMLSALVVAAGCVIVHGVSLEYHALI